MPAVGDSEMRAAELVRRAEKHVAAERLDVHGLVRSELYCVNPEQSTDRMRELGDAGDVDDRPDGVR